VDGILGHNLLLSQAFSLGIPSWMGFRFSRSLFFTNCCSFQNGILAIWESFTRTFSFFHDGILAIRKPFLRTFSFSTIKFWLSRSLSHELFSFFTMELWLLRSLSHELFPFFTMEFWLSRSLSHEHFIFSRWNSRDTQFGGRLFSYISQRVFT
jgi:hypothetical protein